MAGDRVHFTASLDDPTPVAFARRAAAIDEWERRLLAMTDPDERAKAIEAIDAMEAADETTFASLRRAIRRGEGIAALAPWLPPRIDAGPHYDALDTLLAGVLALQEPAVVDPRPPRNMVFYQPTPARHIVDGVLRSALGPDDVLMDLGSGLGHVPLLAAILTGARTMGVDREPAYVETAWRAARALGLTRVSFAVGDARAADLTSASVFYLFTPFIGPILRDMLAALETEASRRPLRIASLGPCTRTLHRMPWLTTHADDGEMLTPPRG